MGKLTVSFCCDEEEEGFEEELCGVEEVGFEELVPEEIFEEVIEETFEETDLSDEDESVLSEGGLSSVKPKTIPIPAPRQISITITILKTLFDDKVIVLQFGQRDSELLYSCPHFLQLIHLLILKLLNYGKAFWFGISAPVLDLCQAF